MSNTLLKNVNGNYDSDIKRMIDLNQDVMNRMLTINNIRLLMDKTLEYDFSLWLVRPGGHNHTRHTG